MFDKRNQNLSENSTRNYYKDNINDINTSNDFGTHITIDMVLSTFIVLLHPSLLLDHY